MLKRLTIWTPKGAALALDENQTEEQARKQLMDMYLIAVDKLARYEDTELSPAEYLEVAAALTRAKNAAMIDFDRWWAWEARRWPMMHRNKRLSAKQKIALEEYAMWLSDEIRGHHITNEATKEKEKP